MNSTAAWKLALDLVGTFAFAVNGSLTATRVDIVGVVTLGMITALGGGILRDVLLGNLPPVTFGDWRYLLVALCGGLLAFLASRQLDRLGWAITVLDAAGLSLFAVSGAELTLSLGLGVGQAIILGAITGVGGGTLRDVLVGRIPTVLRSELYAIPALVGAGVLASASTVGLTGPLLAVAAAAACFLVRMLGVGLHLNAPQPPGRRSAG